MVNTVQGHRGNSSVCQDQLKLHWSDDMAWTLKNKFLSPGEWRKGQKGQSFIKWDHAWKEK